MSSVEGSVLNFKEILELIDKVADRGIAGLEVEQAGVKIRIEGKPLQPQVIHSYLGEMKNEQPMLSSIPVHALPPSGSSAPSSASASQDESEDGLHIITSPIVGTFYRMPNPESEPFVSVGDRISRGKVLCIVEAMKLMNEIEADVEGVITRIYPQNGQPIEYGEKLFAVKLS
jgi:acetyl-CoA carboxylase biotin carboxyl carrier protein